MSRYGYLDDCGDDEWRAIMWRGTVKSAIRGKRGQAFLRELIEALDAMPDKRLIANELESRAPAFIPPQLDQPMVCAIGSVGARRGIDLQSLDPEDYNSLAKTFGIAAPMVQEIEWRNDELHYTSPKDRWRRIRDWAELQLKDPR